jgi:hypothetical protein
VPGVLSRRLVYIFTWSGVRCVAVGPAGATPTPTTCTLVDLVDAMTGKTAYTFQDSGT